MYNAYRMRGVFKGFKISQHETSGKGLHPKLLLCIRTKTTEKWPFYQRGKTKEMKGEENMTEWRRLEERQDHNEGQKDVQYVKLVPLNKELTKCPVDQIGRAHV